METFLNFLVNNWQYISSGILALLTIIAMIVKKKPIKTFVDEFYGELVNLIQDAEDAFGSGSGVDKKKYVLGSFLCKHPDRSASDVSDAIEDILSTPQKKGDKFNGKK